jgi:hypothetical protein
MMIKLDTPLGPLFIRSSEILAVAPERGSQGHSLIYCGLFPEGVSINKSPLEILELIIQAEYEEEEIEFEIEDDEAQIESDEEE